MEFIPASVHCLIRQTKKSIVTTDDFNKFFSNNTSALLHCVCENINTDKGVYKLLNKLPTTLKLLKKHFPSCPLVLDSGGFQIANGNYSKKTIDDYIPLYHHLLRVNKGMYNKYFTLDIPPNNKVFSSFEEVYDFNNRSYKLAHQKNEGNSIFVLHIHDWNLYKIWNKLFEDYNDGFESFAIGGVTSRNLGRYRKIIVYALMFRIIIDMMLKTNRKNINLHILGVAGTTTNIMMILSLLSVVAESVYGIKINISFDSSQQGRIARGRLFPTFYKDSLYELDWCSDKIFTMFGGMHIQDYICKQLNEFAHENDIDTNITKLYNDNEKTDMTIYNILVMYDISVYLKVKNVIELNAPELFSIYLNDRDRFHKNLIDLLKRLNNNKLTKSLYNAALDIGKFLDILNEKDMNHINTLMKQNGSDMFNSGVLEIPEPFCK